MDLATTRELTLARLEDLGCSLEVDVPPLAGPLTPQPVEDVVTRLFCLHATAAASFGFERGAAHRWLEAEGLGASLVEPELAYLEGRGGDAFLFQVRIEAMWALAWAMGLAEEMAADEQCDDDFVLQMPDLRLHEGTSHLRKAARLRGVEELVDQLDLYRCLHAAATTAELGGTPLPPDLAMHTIAQRYHALAWLLGSDAWDRVRLAN